MNEDFGFEDFESALFDGDYQTDGDTDTEETDTAETEPTETDTHSEGDNGDESGEKSEDEHTSESEESGAQGNDKPNKAESEQTFTIKVNKEERQVSREEMITLAQKGSDYDRVKGQLETSRQNEQALQEKLNAHSGVLDVLNIISEQTSTPLDKLVDQLYVNLQRGNGKTETEARQDLENARLRKENNALKNHQQEQKAAQEDVTARAQRDLAEFRKHFPDVQLTQELCEKLTPDIQAGMSLSVAYMKHENARKDAENAELQRRIAAADQNKKNRSKSPGSQQDSGGRRTKTDYEEFERALFG